MARVTIILIAAAFCYAYWVVDPALRYHGFSPDFFFEAGFLSRYCTRAGGLLEAFADFGAQLDCRPVLGAGAFAALVACLAWGIRLAGGESGGRSLAAGIHWLPVLPLLALYGRYSPPAHAITMGALSVVALLAIWRKWAPGIVWLRVAMFWVLSGLLLYGAGVVPFLLFVLAGSGREAIARRAVLPAVACWLAIGWLALATAWFPELRPTRAWEQWGNGLAVGLTVASYLLLVAIVWLGAARERMVAAVRDRADSARSAAPSPTGRFRVVSKRPQAGLWVGAGAATIIFLASMTDTRRNALLTIQYNGANGQWERVLEAASQLEDYPASARLLVHRALFHTGRLCDDWLRFPEARDQDLLPSFEAGLDICLVKSDTLLELGYVNLAERYVYEALQIRGERPEILRRLARVNVLQDRPKAARIFLRRLAQAPFHRAEAAAMLRELDADPTWAGDPLVAAVRATKVEADLTGSRFDTRVLLEAALESDPLNRMAFEYLMVHLLRTGEIQGVVKNLPRLREAGYRKLPRHIAEAVVLYGQMHGEEAGDLAGWSVPRETAGRFQRYLDAARRSALKEPAENPDFAREYGDTYWFYAQFGRSRRS